MGFKARGHLKGSSESATGTRNIAGSQSVVPSMTPTRKAINTEASKEPAGLCSRGQPKDTEEKPFMQEYGSSFPNKYPKPSRHGAAAPQLTRS